jgi:hypothetical protein
VTFRLATSSSPPPVPWHVALGRRIATLWVVKMIGTTLGISGFFFLYFWVMHNPLWEPAVMPLTRLDHWVGVSDDAMLLYGSLWFYISLAPAFAKDKAELRACARDAALMAAIGLLVFWFFPTVVPVFPVDWSQYPSLQFLKSGGRGRQRLPVAARRVRGAHGGAAGTPAARGGRARVGARGERAVGRRHRLLDARNAPARAARRARRRAARGRGELGRQRARLAGVDRGLMR